jgi:hypothetical protein
MKKKLTKRQKDAINAAKQHSARKPVTLAQPTDWDLGPRTAAQDRLKVVEPVTQWDEAKQREVPNPNGVKRARRIDLAEYYFRKGRFDARQLAAAKALAQAWENTQRSPEAIKKVQVDSDPDYGAIMAMQLDRVWRFHAIRRLIPDADWPVLECVCIRNASVAQAGYRGERFQVGCVLLGAALTRLGERMGL